MNPNNKEWVDAGVATLLESEAEILNANSKVSGIRYIQVKTTRKTTEK